MQKKKNIARSLIFANPSRNSSTCGSTTLLKGETRPWGNYQVLHIEKTFQVKRVEVNPGHRLSYQLHHRRAEKWTIVAGEGIVTLDDREIVVAVGTVIAIPAKTKHRIQNNGTEPLIFVEVQLGDYFGEDDIVRFADDYHRK
jgi:mannose-6-phosphate isomerase